MTVEQKTVPYMPFDLTRRRPPLGRLIWPWRVVTTEVARRAPLASLIRRSGQAIGVHFRLPDGAGHTRHYGLSIRWARPS